MPYIISDLGASFGSNGAVHATCNAARLGVVVVACNAKWDAIVMAVTRSVRPKVDHVKEPQRKSFHLRKESLGAHFLPFVVSCIQKCISVCDR